MVLAAAREAVRKDKPWLFHTQAKSAAGKVRAGMMCRVKLPYPSYHLHRSTPWPTYPARHTRSNRCQRAQRLPLTRILLPALQALMSNSAHREKLDEGLQRFHDALKVRSAAIQAVVQFFENWFGGRLTD